MKYLYILTLALILSSCGGSDPNSVSPVGTLTAYVNLYDEFGNKQSVADGARVTLNNIHPKKTGSTDSKGRCELLNTNPGKYDIVFSKPGYGDYWMFQVNHNQRHTTLDAVDLIQVSGTAVSNLKVTYNTTTTQYEVEGTITPVTPDSRWVRIFIDQSPDVSATNYKYSPQNVYSVNNGAFKILMNKEEITSLGIAQGAKFYAIMYGSTFKYTSYFDPGKKLNLYPSLSGASNVAEGTVN